MTTSQQFYIWSVFATLTACGNDFDGDNLCMASACQWEGITRPAEPDVIVHTPGCSWESAPHCDCGADPGRSEHAWCPPHEFLEGACIWCGVDEFPAEPDAEDVEALAKVLLAERLCARGLPPELVTDERMLVHTRVRARSVLASGWLDAVRRKAGADALTAFADTRGVNVGDEDDDWWRGYRQAQRECLRDSLAAAARIVGESR